MLQAKALIKAEKEGKALYNSRGLAYIGKVFIKRRCDASVMCKDLRIHGIIVDRIIGHDLGKEAHAGCKCQDYD